MKRIDPTIISKTSTGIDRMFVAIVNDVVEGEGLMETSFELLRIPFYFAATEA